MNEIVHLKKPLAELSFDQAITVSPLLIELKNMAVEELNRKIQFTIPEAANLIIQALDFSYKRGTFAFELSKNGQLLVKLGEATPYAESGKLLPHIRSPETGKIIEQFKGADFQLASKLASVSSMIVGAAHIISGADISRKLDRIQEGVSFLVAARKIDQLADLRSIYEYIRELLSLEKTSETEQDLKKEVRHLSKLRYTWINEIEFHLHQISCKDSYESKSWLKKLFSREKKANQEIANKLTPFSIELQLIDFTLAMELLIYEYCGISNYLSEVRMADEVTKIQKIKRLFNEKSSLLTKEDIDVNSVIADFDDLIGKWECFVSGFNPEIAKNVSQIQRLVKENNMGRNDNSVRESIEEYKNWCLKS